MQYEYISWKDFEPGVIEKRLSPGKSKKSICKDYMSLDTETSTDEEKENAWIYQWCFSYPKDKETRYLVYGRRPSEMSIALHKIQEVNCLDEKSKLICYVHNLSYDYTYFHKFLEEKFEGIGNILAVGSHNLISYNLKGIEFRDSLKIAMKSLDAWCKELNTTHKKLTGTIDYKITRYQDSKLCKKDWDYMFYDVICLDEAVEKEMKVNGDHIWSIPLTNTGYVRRETRKEFKKNAKNRNLFVSRKLTMAQYAYLKKEFAGGLTHGNRHYMMMKVTLDYLRRKFKRDDIIIKHRDFASHYPSQQVCKTAPVTKFYSYFDKIKDKKPMYIDELFDLENQNFSYLAGIIISNLRLKDGVTLPIAQQCKFFDGRMGDPISLKKWQKNEIIGDNGRIIEMTTGASYVVVNEYDLKWLYKQYTFDYDIVDVYVAKKGKYPKYLTDTVFKYFYEKSFYKMECKRLIEEGYSEDSMEYREMNLKLQIAKARLNSIYGMSATDPVRVSFYENADGTWGKELLTEEDIEAKLSDFYDNKNSFMNYELGAWCTSQARDELLTFCELIGYEYFLYADTDSIFYISTPEIEEKIEAMNAKFREEDEKNGWYIEVNGKKVYFNQFEDEKENIVEFKFLHAKCYAYVTDKGETFATIAGVKKYGRNGISRVEELGDLDELRPGKKFVDCGGTMIKYPPKDYDITPRKVDINGHMTEISQYGIIMESEKELSSVFDTSENIFMWEVDSFDTV